MSATTNALGFAALTAIQAGEMDDHLGLLLVEIKKRRAVYDHTKPPSRVGLEDHQVWAWMNGPGAPHWEVRGTGAKL